MAAVESGKDYTLGKGVVQEDGTDEGSARETSRSPLAMNSETTIVEIEGDAETDGVALSRRAEVVIDLSRPGEKHDNLSATSAR